MASDFSLPRRQGKPLVRPGVPSEDEKLVAGLTEKAMLAEELRLAAKPLEARVEDRTGELQAANAQLEAASRHKSGSLANVFHELRTPLNSILGFAQIRLEQMPTVLLEKQFGYLTNSYGSGQHLLQRFNDILDLSEVEAGKVVLQPEPHPVATTLEDILVIARGLAHKKGQTIQADLGSDLLPVLTDPGHFTQILVKLLSTIMEFTPDHGTIRVPARHGRARSAQGSGDGSGSPSHSPQPLTATTDGWVELAVIDMGIGIRAKDLPCLFQEFVQLEATATKRYEGTCRGLARTKRLVELHGGCIEAESPGEGKGSRFTVLLPVRGPQV